MPCRSITFAISRTGLTRSHIVFGKGVYTESVDVRVVDTAAASLTFHGNGAAWSSPVTNDGSMLQTEVGLNIRDLTMSSTSGGIARFLGSDPSLLERVSFNAYGDALSIEGSLTLRDFAIDGGVIGLGIGPSAHLIAERGTIANVDTGIAAGIGGILNIKNVLIHDVTGLAFNAERAAGSIEFTTVSDTGTTTNTGPTAILCNTDVTVRSSIVWIPKIPARAAVAGCNIVSSIAGPFSIPGVLDSDPRFVDPAQHNYHIATNSPAIDLVPVGPTLDFEADPRPQGARFDIGADEAKE